MTLPLVSTFDAVPGAGVSELPEVPQAAASGFREEWFFDSGFGGFGGSDRSSSSGVRVSPMKALGHCPFWQGVNIIAGDIGQLPIRVQRREQVGKHTRWIDDYDTEIDWLLNEEPNPWQTAEVFKETLQLWALLYGNGCAAIIRDRTGKPIELIPLFPERLRCVTTNEGELDEGRMLVYTLLGGRQVAMTPEEVFHIQGLATDGFWGKSAVEVARDVLGLGIAAREHAAGTMKNGGRPSGMLKTPYDTIDNEARAVLRREWERVHGGVGNASRLGILPNGMEYVAVSMSNVEAQLLELMKLDREQAASLLNLPAHMLNALENAAVRANVAESNRDYHRRTLARWGARYAGQGKRKLLPKARRRKRDLRVFVDAEGLTGGNADDRMNRAVKGVRGKVITRNEGRELNGLNPVEDGDEFENPAIDTVGGSDDERDASNEAVVDEMQEEIQDLRARLDRVGAAIGS